MNKENAIEELAPGDYSRRRLLALSAGTGLITATAPLRALAATPAVPRIFQVLYRGETEAEQGFKDYFAENNFKADITVRNINRDITQLPAILEEIRASKPDLIYVWGTGVTIGVAGTHDKVNPQKNITNIPIVFSMVADPVGAKIIKEWGTPTGRNVTGVSHSVPLDAQLKAMATYRPLRKLGAIYVPNEANSLANLKSLELLSRQLNFQLVAKPAQLDDKHVPIAANVPDYVAELAKQKVDWLYIGPDNFAGDNRGPLTAKAIELGIPVFTGTELEVRTSDALCGLVSRYYTTGQFAAFKAMQILKEHVSPDKIPPERMKSFSFVINMRAAKALKLYPPMTLLNYAELINLNQS